MHDELFLNKEDQRSYALLKYLEESSTLSETFYKIQEEFSLSTFLMKKTMEQLQQDIQRFGLADSFELIVSEIDLTLEINGNCSSKLFLAKYISESLAMKFIIAFFNQTYTSVEEFAEQNHVSYSVAYSTLQRVKKALKSQQIYLEKRKLSGDLQQRLFFLYHLFSLVEIAPAELYQSAVIEKAQQITARLTARYSLSAYEQKRLFHYSALLLSWAPTEGMVLNQAAQQLFSQASVTELKDYLALDTTTISYQLLFWLYLQDKLAVQQLQLGSDATINQLNTLFLAQFEQRFALTDPALQQKLAVGLYKIHFHIVHYPLNKFEDFSMNIYFFKQSYPEFYFYLIDYLREVGSQVDELATNKVFLFFHYLMLLITTVPIEKISKPVKLLIDFSYGKAYNQFIQKNLSLYAHLNVVLVEPNAAELPDIVITNINELYQEMACEVVVWLDPPRAVDWVNLTRVLLAIQEANYHQTDQ